MVRAFSERRVLFVHVKRPALAASMEWPKDARDTALDEWVTPARRYATKRGITRNRLGLIDITSRASTSSEIVIVPI